MNIFIFIRVFLTWKENNIMQDTNKGDFSDISAC